MFRPLALLAAAGSLAAFAPAARAADNNNEAREVIEKAVKAHGGADMAKYKATQGKNKGKIDIPGLGETEFTQEVSTMLPDKLKESLEMTIGGQKVSVTTLVNGDKTSIEV